MQSTKKWGGTEARDHRKVNWSSSSKGARNLTTPQIEDYTFLCRRFLWFLPNFWRTLNSRRGRDKEGRSKSERSWSFDEFELMKSFLTALMIANHKRSLPNSKALCVCALLALCCERGKWFNPRFFFAEHSTILPPAGSCSSAASVDKPLFASVMMRRRCMMIMVLTYFSPFSHIMLCLQAYSGYSVFRE